MLTAQAICFSEVCPELRNEQFSKLRTAKVALGHVTVPSEGASDETAKRVGDDERGTEGAVDEAAKRIGDEVRSTDGDDEELWAAPWPKRQLPHPSSSTNDRDRARDPSIRP